MANAPLQLPVLQNWSCQSCAGCCRQHLILITDEERQRIEGQQWNAGDDQQLPDGAAPLANLGGQWRLNHQADGACVFLNDDGLCRIHAKFGEHAKPLACRVYPYALHPAGKEVTVSLRFSCPTVVANAGKPVSEQRSDIRSIAKAVVPDGYTQTPPPEIRPGQMLDWPDTLRFVKTLDAVMADDSVPVSVRLRRNLAWLELIKSMKFDQIRGDRLQELLEILAGDASLSVPTDAAHDSTPDVAVPPASGTESSSRRTPAQLSPTWPVGLRRTARMVFRVHLAVYARRDTALDLEGGMRNRLRLLKAIVRFARGTGEVPPLQDGFRPVPFTELARSFGPLPAESEELFARYFRVKLQGLHFCGAAFYNIPVVEGFNSLALMYPITLWFARWLAASDGRQRITHADVSRALSVADHNHGYSPELGKRSARGRVKTLMRLQSVSPLISQALGTPDSADAAAS